MSVTLLREMFDRMVVAKNAALVPEYYHPGFRTDHQRPDSQITRADEFDHREMLQ